MRRIKSLYTNGSVDKQTANSMHLHFSQLAQKYCDLRLTDEEPIQFIRETLGQQQIRAADIGCGSGRYVLKLFQHFSHDLYLHCLDTNGKMLNYLRNHLLHHNLHNFKVKKASAEKIPLSNDSLDCIFTFNAVHHFNIIDFFKEVSRILRNNGYLFIYTRTRTQNSRNLWGKYFPLFKEKETRLYELNELEAICDNHPGIYLDKMKFFTYKRKSNIASLIEQAKNFHYSTFRLYSKNEFEESLEKFKQNIQQNFDDLDNIEWYDQNVMLVIKK